MGTTQAATHVETLIGLALIECKFDPKAQLKEIGKFMEQLGGTAHKSTRPFF